MERKGRHKHETLVSGSLPISKASWPAERLHNVLAKLNPEGYDLKRISVFENPIRANLEYLKTRSRLGSIFRLEVSIPETGDALLYNIDTGKQLFARKSAAFRSAAETALEQILDDHDQR